MRKTMEVKRLFVDLNEKITSVEQWKIICKFEWWEKKYGGWKIIRKFEGKR